MATSDDAAYVDCVIDVMVHDALNAGVPHLQHMRKEPCCSEHNGCDLPGEMICCENCPDMDRCGCGHGWHLHDAEAVPALCTVCGDDARCAA